MWNALVRRWRDKRGEAGPAPIPAADVDWIGIGNTALGEGRLPEAIDAYDRATQADPRNPAAWLNRGFARLEAGDTAAALDDLRRCVTLADPAQARLRGDAHFLIGRAQASQGLGAEAAAAYEAALAAVPDFGEARDALFALWVDQARALHAQGAHDESLRLLDRLLARDPAFAPALDGRGVVLLDTGRAGEALAAFEQAAAAGGADADRLCNLAAASQRLARLDEAIAYADRAIALAPADASARWNRALAHLLRGDLARGWEDFEARWAAGVVTADTRLHEHAPRWEGQDLHGRSILLDVEQGLGDTLQFMRYVPELAARGARVWLRVPTPLLALARRSVHEGTVLGLADTPPPVDFYCELMSVPRHLGIAVDAVPAAVPYLHADPLAVQQWEATLAEVAPGRLRVGLAWSGNPAHLNDSNRSIDPQRLQPLAAVDALFVTMKPGAHAADRQALAAWPRVFDAGPQIRDFADTAALVQALDVIVSVDTSIAHLAGGLGKPVWILLPWLPDWRWMLGREDSPWYPTARLYRQPQPQDWGLPLERVRADLERLARAGRAGA